MKYFYLRRSSLYPEYKALLSFYWNPWHKKLTHWKCEYFLGYLYFLSLCSFLLYNSCIDKVLWSAWGCLSSEKNIQESLCMLESGRWGSRKPWWGRGGTFRNKSDKILSDQIRSVAQSCPTLCDPMNCSTPGLPVHHQLPEFTQTHVHWVSDAIQPSHPLSSPCPPAPNPSQHQSLFQWVNPSHEVAKVLEIQL